MSTEFFNDQWRIPSNENQNKVSNYSMEFDGTSSIIDISGISSSLSSSGTGTFSGWLKWDGTSVMRAATFSSNSVDRQYIIILVLSDGKAYAQLKDSWQLITSSAVFTANVWTHFVVSHNGTAPKFYINGSVPLQGFTQITNKTHWWSHLSTFNTVNIGAMTWSNGNNNPTINYGAGVIDQVAIFDYSLLDTEVSDLYGDGTAVVSPMTLSPAPVGYYQLGDQSAYNGANYLVPNNSLSGSEGYSPYALDFDGVNDYLDTPQIDLGSTNTISFWINTTTTTQGTLFGDPNGYADYALFSQPSLNRTAFRLGNNDSGYYQIQVSSGLLNDGNWHHHCLTRNGVTLSYYIDGVLQTNVVNNTLNASAGTNTTIENIMAMPNANFKYGGKLSNVALWNIELTSTEVTEIYNSSIPSDLNTFSGTAPVAWWQLGSNSSFNTNWTCLDEIGTNNGVSAGGMTNDDIVDGVGYSASGVGTSSIDIKGDAPYSTANGLSKNMDVLDRVTDIPS